jgi:hypothetical protein
MKARCRSRWQAVTSTAFSAIRALYLPDRNIGIAGPHDFRRNLAGGKRALYMGS